MDTSTSTVLDAQQVAQWPRVAATVTEAGTGTLTVNGTERACAGDTIDALRAGIVARCVSIAREVRRPIRLDVTQEGFTHALAVRPEGYVQLLDNRGHITELVGEHTLLEGRCRRCRRLQPVIRRHCVQCELDEPLRVEAQPRESVGPVLRTEPSFPPMEEPIEESTALSARGATASHALVLTIDGEEPIHTGAHVAVGRRPTADGDRELITVTSPGRQVSRTHAHIDVDEDGQILITDLNSGNGIELQSEPPRWLTPGTPTAVPVGATVLMGDVYCVVTRADGVSSSLR